MGGNKKKVRFTVTFETWMDRAEAGEWEMTNRLRGLLKVAGRRFAMRNAGLGVVEEVEVRAEPGKGKGFVCAGWRSKSGQGKFW